MTFEVEDHVIGLDAKYAKSSWEMPGATVDVKNPYKDDSSLVVR